MMGAFCNTCFLTMISRSKHFQGMYFYPPLLTWKYFENSWNFFSWNFVIFSNFTHFTYIFLTNHVQKMTSTKIEQKFIQMNRFFQIVWRIRFWKILFIICSNFIIFGRIDSFEHISGQSLFKSFFVHNLVRKIYVKMSKIWKNDKISGKKIFMNFRDIFMWVLVDENTSPGSVLNTISWSENMYCKKPPSFWTPR